MGTQPLRITHWMFDLPVLANSNALVVAQADWPDAIGLDTPIPIELVSAPSGRLSSREPTPRIFIFSELRIAQEGDGQVLFPNVLAREASLQI
jgi:hypothetical protein